MKIETNFLKELIKTKQLFNFIQLKNCINENRMLSKKRILAALNSTKYEKIREIIFHEFEKFMLENNCTAGIFFNEIEKQGRCNPNWLINFKEPHCPLNSIIFHYLAWYNTSHGGKFWCNLDEKWELRFDTLILKPLYDYTDNNLLFY